MNWVKKLFAGKHECMYREADVYFYDDPKCAICGKFSSVRCKEKGMEFIPKSPKRMVDELLNKIL